jgi:hypothetical protein
MSRTSAEWDWGAWMIGDLADVVRRTADVLGSALEPVRVSATPPSVPGELPRVVVVVADQHTVFRLRSEVRREENLAVFVGQPTARMWRAEVDGLDLTVALECEEETP